MDAETNTAQNTESLFQSDLSFLYTDVLDEIVKTCEAVLSTRSSEIDSRPVSINNVSNCLDMILSGEDVRLSLSKCDTSEIETIRKKCQGILEDRSSSFGSGVANAAKHLEEKIFSNGADVLPETCRYSCLPVCLFDAVFSITYLPEAARSILAQYCRYAGIPMFRKKGAHEEDYSTLDFLASVENAGSSEQFVKSFITSRQALPPDKTIASTIDEIVQYAQFLRSNGITTIGTFKTNMTDVIRRDFASLNEDFSTYTLKALLKMCSNSIEIGQCLRLSPALSPYFGFFLQEDEVMRALTQVTELLKQTHADITMKEVAYIIRP